LQRLSAMVNDMLFLASADRGASARRGAPVSLAALAREVVEFHEATLEDAALAVRIEGDATLAVDEPLVRRALSNLIGNATRYATSGTAITVQIAPERVATEAVADAAVRIDVANQGEGIVPAQLPRIFDRFFRADTARCCNPVDGRRSPPRPGPGHRGGDRPHAWRRPPRQQRGRHHAGGLFARRGLSGPPGRAESFSSRRPWWRWPRVAAAAARRCAGR
jgi:hypothetical protein